MLPLKSPAYMTLAMPICLRLLRQAVCCALRLARLRAGRSIAAKMAMMAMTTNNSIRVKALPFAAREEQRLLVGVNFGATVSFYRRVELRIGFRRRASAAEPAASSKTAEDGSG